MGNDLGDFRRSWNCEIESRLEDVFAVIILGYVADPEPKRSSQMISFKPDP